VWKLGVGFRDWCQKMKRWRGRLRLGLALYSTIGHDVHTTLASDFLHALYLTLINHRHRKAV
jgi:hypothetical protein